MGSIIAVVIVPGSNSFWSLLALRIRGCSGFLKPLLSSGPLANAAGQRVVKAPDFLAHGRGAAADGPVHGGHHFSTAVGGDHALIDAQEASILACSSFESRSSKRACCWA